MERQPQCHVPARRLDDALRVSPEPRMGKFKAFRPASRAALSLPCQQDLMILAGPTNREMVHRQVASKDAPEDGAAHHSRAASSALVKLPKTLERGIPLMQTINNKELAHSVLSEDRPEEASAYRSRK